MGTVLRDNLKNPRNGPSESIRPMNTWFRAKETFLKDKPEGESCYKG